MFLFIIAIVVFIGFGIAAALNPRLRAFLIGAGVLVGVGLIILSTVYTQEVGEAMVIKNADGTIDTTDTTAGLGFKAPWQDQIQFDITGQQALFKLDGKPSDSDKKEKVDGPSITVTTQNVSSEVDVAVRYSINPDSVKEIYTNYKTQEGLYNKVISQDIKTVVRDSANGMTTDDLLGKRAEYGQKIEAGLKSRWQKQGIIVDSVALQGIRPPQSVLDNFNAAQNASTKVVQEQANTKVIEEQAKQKVIAAQGEADANRKLAESLTDPILKQKYIDALANAKQLIVVPNGSGSIVQVPSAQ